MEENTLAQIRVSTKAADTSDNESITSVTSDLSEMEPFPEYLPKIEQLVCDIGLAGFSIEALQHGYSFQNCVYALKSFKDDKEQYILRVPVCPNFRETDQKCVAVENDVAILGFLVDKLPVPRVTAYSATKENPLNAPFTVQTRLAGQSLDLEARNIMVEKRSGRWKISGVIDWDDALALPRPLARKPPAWIWDFDPDGFTGYLDNDHHPNADLSDENRALKSHFDATAAAALPAYLEDAYGRGRWLRRIWTFARSGADDMWYIELIKQLPRDWATRPKPVVPQPEKPNGLWEKWLHWVLHRAQAFWP